MSESVDKLRNIALVAHGGAGKTSLAEVMLNKAGVTKRIGRIEDGNTVMDFEPEEIKRQSSISTGLHQFAWKKHSVTLMDTPGDQNFFSDTRLSMQAVDSVVMVVDAVDGVKFQTEQAWDFATEFGQPGIVFINKLDRERASFKRALDDAVNSFEPKPIVMQLPIGKEAGFKGDCRSAGKKGVHLRRQRHCDRQRRFPPTCKTTLRPPMKRWWKILLKPMMNFWNAISKVRPCRVKTSAMHCAKGFLTSVYSGSLRSGHPKYRH